MSLLVGTFLMLINYGDTLWERGYFIEDEIIKIFLTYLIPYCVSTFSSVAAYKRYHPELKGIKHTMIGKEEFLTLLGGYA